MTKKDILKHRVNGSPERAGEMAVQLHRARKSLGTMDVNASDQLGRDETGEMMHKSDDARVNRLLMQLGATGSGRAESVPVAGKGGDIDVERADAATGKQGVSRDPSVIEQQRALNSRGSNLGKYLHPPKRRTLVTK